jgi:adenosylcobinamide kinase / adenosylcobinamide-phosphate guanylyltransferase
MFTLVLGGARSGKSAAAEHLALASGRPVVFVATATPGDAEMAERIEAHRQARPAHWSTVEEPIDIEAVLASVDPDSFLVLDCLTLWVSNLIGAGFGDETVLARAAVFSVAAAARPGGMVIVSNEVGSGIVPDNALGRRYRDLLGMVNTTFAGHAERALMMVAGRVVELRALVDV